MKINVNYCNPLTEEQKVLNDICSKIEQKVVLKSNKSQGSYFVATASFEEGSEFYGYAEREGSELKTMLKAQICAVTNLLTSAGYDINFLLSSNRNEETKPSKKIETVNRYFITSAPDVDYAIKELEKLGIDTTDIKNYRDDLLEKGERLTKNKLAEFMFPARSKTVVTVEKEEAKRPAKRVEPTKMEVKTYSEVRTPEDASNIMSKLRLMGIDEKTYNNSKFFDTYNSLTLFCLYGKEEEINQLM